LFALLFKSNAKDGFCQNDSKLPVAKLLND